MFSSSENSSDEDRSEKSDNHEENNTAIAHDLVCNIVSNTYIDHLLYINIYL